ncbi:MAG: polar amino acid transport system substrate-binding protein [Oceanicoccus sp.]
MPFKQGLYQAAIGECIIIGIVKTDELMEALNFSEPVYQERISVFFNQQQKTLTKTIDKLEGLVIGELLGWCYAPEFDRDKVNHRFFTKDGDIESNFYNLTK